MRDDLSNKLVHLAKGTGDDPAKARGEALTVLGKIIGSSTLKGGTGYIKGAHKCVCFSEAPISKLSQILASKTAPKGFKYQPYGVLVDKKWLYTKGGRPVIYGPENEYDLLPDEMKHRHVRFQFEDDYEVDHTWEREWRIKTDVLAITPDEVTLVVPSRGVKASIVKKFGSDWHFIVLGDLGVEVAPL